MRTAERACLEQAETMLRAAGFTTTTRRGKHLRLTARSPAGREGHMTFSSSPRSDLKSQLNFVRQETQRLIRKLLAPMDSCLTPV